MAAPLATLAGTLARRWLQGQALQTGAGALAGDDANPGARAAAAGLGIAIAIPLVVILVVVLPAFIVLELLPAQKIDGRGAPDSSIEFVPMYEDAAAVYGQNAFLLMAIHGSESTFSTGEAPGIHSGVNSAGCCAGPMQFDLDTWRSAVGGHELAEAFRRASLARPEKYPGQTADHPSIYDSYDSIYAAALYLKGLGAVESLDSPSTLKALVTYKGETSTSHPNADATLADARGYAAAMSGLTSGTTPQVPGSTGRILPNGLAAAPADAPPEVRRMIAAANEINDKPYKQDHRWPNDVIAPVYDCSSSTSRVLWAGGKFGLVPACSAGFTGYGQGGRGKWVTIYARGPCGGGNGHVFMIIAGLRFDTNYGWETGGPNRGERGPRWRQGDYPKHDLATYAERHPVGL